jgi:DNA mismatch repair protein MutL
MPRISVLPEKLRNKIAAGEVVERPAAVVKELIENSIDAACSRVEVDVSGAGRKLISVADNGCGMSREDALLAFERYATSKISEERDLFNIRTMGFRGEALSSIAAVADVKLSTAEPGETGICIEIAGGEIKSIRDCPMTGTSVEVKDLFYNTPARRKFLKSDATENLHIINAVTNEALSHFSISFALRLNNADILGMPIASSFRERLVQAYGMEFVAGLLEIEREEPGLAIHAFAGNATVLRNNKTNQHIFINRRPVRDQSLSYAVCRAYEGLIPKDKHPVFFLFLEIDPSRVDFNVHPAKKEVRFSDKNRVFNFIHMAVKQGMKDETPVYGGDCAPDTGLPVDSVRPDHSSEDVSGYINKIHAGPCAAGVVGEPGLIYDERYEGVPFIYLGDTFVAVPVCGGLMLVDYHAAHERINYEMMLKKMEVSSSRLLFPRQVVLDTAACRAVIENAGALNELGLAIEEFGKDTVIVRALPEFLRDADINGLLSDVASALMDEVKFRTSGLFDTVQKAVAAKLACHSSVRGREVPDGARLAELLKSLDRTDSPDRCPHGRPTRIFMSMGDLRKRFGKT